MTSFLFCNSQAGHKRTIADLAVGFETNRNSSCALDYDVMDAGEATLVDTDTIPPNSKNM